MNNKKTQVISESELKGIIENIVREALMDEGFGGFLKGVGSAIGGKFANAGRKAGQAINKQYQDIKTAGQQASMRSDHQRNLKNIEKQNNKIIAQLQAWQQQGVFQSRQANSSVAMLIKALQNNYDQTQARQNADFENRFNPQTQPQQ